MEETFEKQHPDIYSDEALAEKAKAGVSSAFSVLSERYMFLIKSRANRYAGVVGQDVEDFIQEGMLALFRAVKGFDGGSGFKFKTYAVTCINNSLFSAIKKHMKSVATVTLPEEESPTQPEELFIEQEASAELASQIQNRLSDFERQVLKLYLKGNSYAEISGTLGFSTKAVDNALQRIRRKLRPEL
jgi:RNA polymerase sporulation-specific sigma factor